MADKNVQVRIDATDDVSAVLGKIQGQLKSFGQTVAGIFTGFGVAIGAAAFGSFFKSSIQQANDADKAYRLLDASLGNLGVRAATVRPQIEATVQSLARLTGKDDSTVVAGLDRLIGLTGNYRKALSLLPLALDVAAARGLNLGEAVDLVGKTANGTVTALNKLGFHATSAAEGLQLLTDRFGGNAAAMANPLDRLSVAWTQVEEAMGRALLGGSALGQGMSPLIAVLTKLERWIVENQDAIGALVATFVRLVSVVLELAGALSFALLPQLDGGALGMEKLGTKAAEAGDQFTRLDKIVRGLGAVLWTIVNVVRDIGPALKLAAGGWVMIFGEVLDTVSGLLDKVGLHFLDTITTQVQAAGKKLVGDATAQLEAVGKSYQNGLHYLATGSYAGVHLLRGAQNSAYKAPPPAPFDDAALKSLQEQVGLAQEMTGFLETRVKGLTQLAALEDRIAEVLKSHVLSDKDRVGLLKLQADLLKTQLKYEPAPLVGQEARVTRLTPRGPVEIVEAGPTATQRDRPVITARQALGPTPGLRDVTPEPSAPVPSLFDAQFGEGIGQSAQLGKAMETAAHAVDSVGSSLGRVAGGALEGFTSSWENAVSSVIDGSKSMGQAIAGAITGAVAAGARAEGQRYLWLAVGDIGDALLGHPGGFAAAAKHLAAGTGLLVLAATLGGGGGGGGAAGGGGGGGSAPAAQPQNQSYTINTGSQTDVRGLKRPGTPAASPGVPTASAGSMDAPIPTSWVASASSPSAAVLRGLAVLGGSVGNGGRLAAAGGATSAGPLSGARFAATGAPAAGGRVVVKLPAGAVLRSDSPELQELIANVYEAGKSRGVLAFQYGSE